MAAVDQPLYKKYIEKGPGLTTTSIALIGLGIFLLLIILTIVYWVFPTGNVAKLTSYVSMLGFLGTLVTILTFLFLQNQTRITNIQSVDVQRQQLAYQNATALNQHFINHRQELLRLYKQMNPDDPTLQALPDPPITADVISLEKYTINMLFQSMENVISRMTSQGIRFDDPYYVGYIGAIRNWFRSQLIRDQWILDANNFNLPTQEFVRSLWNLTSP